jgi:peptidoglycan/LPS O-acetylase OafA/YrhL
MKTLAELPKENSIGFIRLIASLSVVYGHSYSIGGFDVWWDTIKITNNQTSEARLAVDVFFILSGFLIAKSYNSCSNVIVFIWHRFLRIFPAFWVCLCIMVLVVYILTGQFEFFFIYHNFSLLTGIHNSIGDAFREGPKYFGINGALWTLPWELRAYCLVAVLGFLGLLNNRKAILLLAMILYVAFVVKILSYSGRETSPAITSGTRLLCFFSWGVVFYNYRANILLKRSVAIWGFLSLSVILFLGVFFVNYSGGLFYITAPIPLTYLVFYISSLKAFSKINSRSDISYGIYIYGTFVLTCLSYMKLNSSWVEYFTFTMVITLTLAWLSWTLVEKKCLKMKNLLDNSRVVSSKVQDQKRN